MPALSAARFLIYLHAGTCFLACPLHAETAPAPIPIAEIGAKATVDYQGDAIRIERTPEGTRLYTGFQKLMGNVTSEGLTLESTEAAGGRLQLTATTVGRTSSKGQSLPRKGIVMVAEKMVAWTRPGLVEEYSVSVDGVRQDFVIATAPLGTGDLSIELALRGARAESHGDGVKLTLDGSARELIYNRLHVTDATGRELQATLLVSAPNHLTVRVADAGAAYPIRIDPTFSDADWVSLNPGIQAANDNVYATAVDGSGNLYIAGDFTVVGTVAANRVAKWNGSTWLALGSGMPESVYALAISGTSVYAGGKFISAGGTQANRIARWTGTTWLPVGSGTDAAVRALAVSGSNLYAAVDSIYITPGSKVAQWNGSSWAILGSAMNGIVNALTVSGSTVYAGGLFTNAGGTDANNIAQWDGNAWTALDTGTDGTVQALALNGSILYAGGDFTMAGGQSASRIAQWDGNAWAPLGSGMNNKVYALTVSGNDLYAGGANRVAKWNGSDWTILGSGMNSIVYSLVVSGGTLYAGGQFTTADNVSANRIARWDGDVWSALGTGMNNTVTAVAVSNGALYIGGHFTSIGNMEINRIARWDGSRWSGLSSGMDGSIYSMAFNGSDLYAAGFFTTAGGTAANCVAKWDGNAWTSLDSGMNGSVYALAVDGNSLYAGGSFTTAGGTVANCIARWDGNAWSALGSGMNSTVYALVVNGGVLYAGGNFTTAGGTTVNRIAKWDSNNWLALGSGAGMNSIVRALAVNGNNLYAGGLFNTADGKVVNHIAKWDGNVWSGLGTGIPSGPVYALSMRSGELYVGGSFSIAAVGAVNVAMWNGNAWSALGTGIKNGTVYALGSVNGKLYLGGTFALAGTTVSPYIAQANLPPAPDIAILQSSYVEDGGTVVWGNTVVGNSVVRTFRIFNPGTADLANLNVSIDGADYPNFTLSALSTTSIPVGISTATFTVTFTPTAYGIKTAAIHIASNVAGDKNPYDIPLTGRGVLPQDTDDDGILDSWEQLYWPGATASHGPLDDDDHDGLVNLLELAFGLNPTVPNAGALTPLTLEGGYLTMTISKQPGAAYEVQSAGTLTPGQPDSFSATTTTILINDATTLKVRDNTPLGTSSTRFMRVQVTGAP
ncbi:MAG: choice-of-anchor D domain-containing protein [Verrucomicrobiaceae bacterium]